MTAAATLPHRLANGPRAVDPRRDLAGLADLIEIAFAGNLDDQGREMTREMRRFGRLGSIGWLLGHLVLPPAAFPQGYVWFEGGRIVGNASLLPVEGSPRRWVMANVAVDPDHRRRGIARSLVGSCLNLAAEREAEEIVLQVKSRNEGARSLYAAFGFADRGTRVAWRMARPAAGVVAASARRRRPSEWEEHWALVRRLHPHGLVWPHPLRSGMFRAPSWLTNDPWDHWVWPEAGRLMAAASGRVDLTGAFHLYLICSAEARGLAEAALVGAALGERRRGPMEIVAETDDGPAERVLGGLGFREEHRLTWMGLELRGRERNPA